MSQDIDAIKDKVQEDLQGTKTLDQLQDVKTAYLGRKGLVNRELQKMQSLPAEKKKRQGIAVNALKMHIKRSLRDKQDELVGGAGSGEWFDVTLPGTKLPKGSLHIVTYAIEEISRIFERLGFIRMSYPEVEWEYFSFESLNMPKEHPARDDFETFFIEANPNRRYGRMVLTPHTSSGQIREMWRVKETLPTGRQAPIKMINMAKTYRPNWDATHTPMFHQFEGLCIDRGINITHLKGTIEHFAKEFFGTDREIRLRPFHFQFTEPSFEVDVTCDMCEGQGFTDGKKCRVCKSGWLELGGAGMVHPNVLREGKIDPKTYTGWAFGFGVERVVMMKSGLKLNDLRIIYSGDVRFLQQF